MTSNAGTQAVVTVVEAPACHFCHDARQALDEMAATYPLRIEVLDVRRPEGLALMQEHRAGMSPLVLLDGRYVSAGRLPRGKLRKLLEARTGAVAS